MPKQGNATSLLPTCPIDLATPLFDTIPIDPNDFLAMRPLGFMSPPIHIFPAKHSAFAMTLPGQKPIPKPVRAPGKGWVTEIWAVSFSTGGANYQLFVYPCREVRVYFGHLAALSEKLTAALKTVQPRCNSFSEGTATVTTCRHENLAVPLDAGEVIGMGPDTAGVDFGVIDFRRPPAAFINLDHYDRFYPYYAPPLDYFTVSAKEVLSRKMGNVFGTQSRTAKPVGGTYMQDIPKTAQGNWFYPGQYHRNSTDLSPSLGLAHDYTNPAQPIIGMGNSVKGMKMGLYSFPVATDGLINREFKQVTADGQVYCYDRFLTGQSEGGMPLGKVDGVLLLMLPSEITLKVELVPGRLCKDLARWAFTPQATTFER